MAHQKLDNRANVVAVGEALTASLRALGFQVVHDTTAFEPPKLSDAYTRSLSMLEARAAAGRRAVDLYIDLHRDAYVKNSGVAQTVTIWRRNGRSTDDADWQRNRDSLHGQARLGSQLCLG